VAVEWFESARVWSCSRYQRLKGLSRHVCKAALGAVPAKGLPVHLVGVKVQGCAVSVAGDDGASSLVLRHASGWVSTAIEN
jgi:hypothetical protein